MHSFLAWVRWDIVGSSALAAVFSGISARISWCAMQQVEKIAKEHKQLMANQRRVMDKLGIKDEPETDPP